jgi:hypothetical protein
VTVAASAAAPKSISVRPLADAGWLVAAAAAVAALALVLFGPNILGDGDSAWHLAAGDWMIRHGEIFRADPFSFTRAGAPWRAQEWLSEVMMAAAFRLAGWTGLVVLFGLAFAGAAVLLARQVGRSLTGVGLILTLVLVLACAEPSLLARPHVLALVPLIGWTSLLLNARAAGRAPPLWIAGLMLIWANMHGSFVIGLMLLGALGLEALIEAKPAQRWATARDWGAFAALSVAAACVTPQGPPGLLFPLQLVSLSAANDIAEWRASDFSQISAFEVSFLAVLFAGLSRGVKVPPLRLLLLLLLLHMGLQHARHVIVLAVVAALILAPAMAQAADAPSAPARFAARPAAWLVALAAVLALVGARAAVGADPGDQANMPGAALAHVPASVRAMPVLNEYSFGGYLILKGVRPFIDGRADMYGDAFVARYARIVSGDHGALEAAIRQYRLAWTILPPDNPVVAELDHEPGWRRLYADKYAVVHVREAGADALR